MRNILLILGAIAVIAVGGLAAYEWLGGPNETPGAAGPGAPAVSGVNAEAVRQVQPEDIVLGQADAPVTVIEYASLTCPHCANFHNEVLPEVKAAYIDTGKIRWVMRDFPLNQPALAGAMLARCAGPERRYALIDLFFNRFNAWTGAQEPIGALARIAGIAGMSEADVNACFAQDAVQNAVLEQRLKGSEAFGIDSTPSFVVNGTLHSGGMTFEEFKAVVDPVLESAGQ